MIDRRQHLTQDPNVCNGGAAGTRVMLRVILDGLGEGASRDQILRSYPSLRPEHIEAAIACAAEDRS